MPLGVLFALLSYTLYSFGDAMTKAFSGQFSVFEINFFINLFAVIPGIFAKAKGDRWRDTFRLGSPWLMHARSLAYTVATVCFVFALTTIPIAEAYSLVFLTPLFVSLLSVIVLKENVSATRWVLVALSFVGVLIVVRPGFRELHPGHFAAVFAAFAAAAATTILRIVSGKERQFSIIAMNGAYQLAVCGVLMLVFGFALLSWFDLARLAVIGLLGGGAQILVIRALRIAPANQVGPTQYVQILWAVIFGAVFYHEFPDQLGYFGLAVLVVAGVATIFSDGAEARIAGRWSEFRARRGGPKFTEIDGPEI